MLLAGKYGIPFHKDCFKCKDCGTLLDPKSGFKVKGNDLYLSSCFEKLAGK